MAGNKKPNRKPGRKTSAVERLDQGKWAKGRNAATQKNILIRMSNALPLGHDVNRHKIDMTFGAIEGYLDEMERTGESIVDARGEPIVIDPVDGEEILAGASLQNQYVVFCALAKRFGWGTVPDGLRRVGAKLSAGSVLFQSDMQDARVAIAWMRAHVANVTPSQWSETMDAISDNEWLADERRIEERNHG